MNRKIRLSIPLLALALATVLHAQAPAPAEQPSEPASPAVAPAPAQPSEAQPAATPNTAAPATAQPAQAAPSALDPKVLEAIGNPPEGKALVVFFRPSKFAGSMIGFIVREENTELGKLRSGNYFTVAVEPGKHAFDVHTEAKDVLHMEAEAGETYFYAGSISLGFMVGHPHLDPSNVAAFQEALPKLKKSSLN